MLLFLLFGPFSGTSCCDTKITSGCVLEALQLPS